MPDFRALAGNLGRQYGIPWFSNQIGAESSFNPGAASPAGAQGIAQIVPRWHPDAPPASDPAGQLQWAANYMAGLVRKYGNPRDALSVYNSGRPWAEGQKIAETRNYVSKILGSTPQGGPPVEPLPFSGPTPSFQTLPARPQREDFAMPMTTPAPDFSKVILSSLSGGANLTNSLVRMASAMPRASKLPSFQSLTPTPAEMPSFPAETSMPQSFTGPLGKTTVGDPIPAKFQTSVGGEHGTSGLAGYSGKDYFAKAGSPAVAPVSGKVIKLSGHDPRLGAVQGAGGPLGWSVYIQGDDGHTYFLTHMGSRDVQVGQTVKAGQPIGTVADYDKFGRASHIHMGFI